VNGSGTVMNAPPAVSAAKSAVRLIRVRERLPSPALFLSATFAPPALPESDFPFING
jgi:hypothetical protein